MFLQLLTGLSLLEIVLGASCGSQNHKGSDYGTVSSPGSPSYYSTNLFCTYDIEVSYGKAVKLRWSTFDVKGKMPSCWDDYVEIFIGCGVRRSIGKYCSENGYKPFDIYSSDNCLRLRFKSDSSVGGKGFVASYSAFSKGSSYLTSSCYNYKTLTSTSGVIASPGWPGNYPSLRDCYWKIEVGSRRSIKIAFMDFDLDYDIGCDDDKVKVKGGSDDQSYNSSSTIKSSACGSKTPFSFTSTKERIWIRFKSSSQFFSSDRGFVAGYVMYDSSSTHSSCGSQDHKDSDNGTVSSPGSPSYYSTNLYCTYDIQVSPGKAVKLTWSTFDVKGKMPSCSDDYVEIFIGCSRRSIGKYCSENGYKPFDIYSSDNCLRLRFKSDSSVGGKGFVASYSAFSKGSSYLTSSCYNYKTLTSTSGVIASPGWPGNYPSLRDCYWKIEVGSRRSIKIAFMDFDLDYDNGCEDDKVKVKGGYDHQSYDSSSTIKSSACGSKTPFSFTSTKERIWIRFKSSSQFFSSDRGFVAGYVMYDSSSTHSSSSSTSTGGAVAAGIIIPLIILVVCVVVVYKFAYRRRLIARQAATAQVLAPPPQQAVVHHPPPPPQPGYAPPPPAGYPAPPPAGYAPPPTGYAPPPQPGYAPPPYSQVVGSAPYPQQDKSGPYPLAPQGAAPPYPPGQPGGAPPYPPGQPGGVFGPYPPEQSGGPAPHPTAPPGGAAPYPTAPPGDAPYPQK